MATVSTVGEIQLRWINTVPMEGEQLRPILNLLIRGFNDVVLWLVHQLNVFPLGATNYQTSPTADNRGYAKVKFMTRSDGKV